MSESRDGISIAMNFIEREGGPVMLQTELDIFWGRDEVNSYWE